MPEDFVQEPDTLLTAPTVPKQVGRQWVCMMVHQSLHVDGQKLKINDPQSGVVGYLPVFNDYEKALAFVDGRVDHLVTVQSQT